jgi:Legume-like lectin family
MSAKNLALFCILLLVLPSASAWGGSPGGHTIDNTPGGPPKYTTKHIRRELITFPYGGRGDGRHAFHNPYRPSAVDGGPVDGWVQEGSAIVTSAGGRDVVRLTNAAQGNQGLFYASGHTETNDINGYFDINMASHPESHEAADGMGFFFTENVPTRGSAMGMDERFKGLGIVIDTFSNSRTRQVPYMYAYVNDGTRKWNADTDGKDIELTKGCQLEMNRPTRIFVQMLDYNLHVAVSMNAKHDQWHTCFRYNNVPMPFHHGGFLAFTAETGHFFALHDVYTAAFIIGDIHHDPAERQRFHDDTERRKAEAHAAAAAEAGAAHHAGRPNAYHDVQERAKVLEAHVAAAAHGVDTFVDQGKAGVHHASDNAAAHEHLGLADEGHGVAAHAYLSAGMDAQVHQIYSELSDALRSTSGAGGAGGATLDEIGHSLQSLSGMTDHMFQEADRQTAEGRDVIAGMQKLRGISREVTSVSASFTSKVAAMHSSVQSLRDSASRMRADHESAEQDIRVNSDILHGSLVTMLEDARPHGFFAILAFMLVQTAIVLGFAAVHKMGHSTRNKLGRMV